VTLRVHVEQPDGPPFDRRLEGAEVIVGRGSAAGIVVLDRSVSRQHVRIAGRDGGWWLEDLGATNPTYLNDRTLEAPVRLKGGDTIKIGDTVLRVIDDAATRSGSHGQAVPEADDRQAARLRTLNDVHRALATAISLQDLLDLILERCFDVLRPEEGVILLAAADGNTGPRRAASRRVSGKDAEVFVSRRIIDEVMGKSKPALVLDAAMDDRFTGSESIIVSGVRSVLAAPLVDADGTLGLIMLSSRVSVRQFSEQDLDLLVSLASAAALRVRNVALAEQAAERKVYEKELSIAHDMQMAMLPRQMPDHAAIAVAASLEPARSVGGDLYDFALEGDRLWFIIADVAGKSVAAALYMAVAKTLFRATIGPDADVAGVAGRMNRELSRDNERMLFVTAVVGSLDIATGVVTLIDAGHNPTVLIDAAGKMTAPAPPKGVAFGVVEDFVYTPADVALEPGATLLLYTDGATDARSMGGEMFGEARLNDAIAGGAGLAPDALIKTITGAVAQFVGGAPPEDDLTLLAIKWRKLTD